MSANFHCQQKLTSKTVGCGSRASKRSTRCFLQLSFDYHIVRLVTKRGNWTLFLRYWKRYWTESKKDASILCVSKTSKISRRHDIWRGWCSCSLCHFRTALDKRNAPKPLDRVSRPDSPTTISARFDSVWLLFMRISDFLCSVIPLQS